MYDEDSRSFSVFGYIANNISALRVSAEQPVKYTSSLISIPQPGTQEYELYCKYNAPETLDKYHGKKYYVGRVEFKQWRPEYDNNGEHIFYRDHMFTGGKIIQCMDGKVPVGAIRIGVSCRNWMPPDNAVKLCFFDTLEDARMYLESLK